MLAAKVEILRSSPGLTLRIDGHADERGSDEYNLALSKRRAAEAKRFMRIRASRRRASRSSATVKSSRSTRPPARARGR